MMKPAIALIAASALTLPLSNLAAANVEIDANGPVVELSVYESVDVAPDTATIGAGVTTEAATATEALRQNSAEMAKVVAKLKAMGIADKDIQTTGINLNAVYDYNGQRPVFRGYQASNRVSVTLRDVARAGPVLDALVAAGATDLSGPSFSIDDDSAPRAQARKAAFDKAQAQATEYARWAGYSGVRVLSVSEAVNPGRPMPMMERAMAVQSADAKSTPVEPGLVGTSVTVNVTFEMTR